MPLSNLFAITIALATVRSGSPGLGKPLIAATGITTEIPVGELRSVANTDDLETLGFENTDPVWLAFESMVGQTGTQNGDSPDSVYIGSRATPVAQVSTFNVPAVPGDGTYSCVINGVIASFVASGSTQAQVAAGLLAAVNGSSQAPFVTATGGVTTVVVTSDQAGRPFTATPVSPGSDMTVTATTPNTGFYDDLDDFADYVRTNRLTGFYDITEVSRLDAALIEGARWVEAQVAGGGLHAFSLQSDDTGIPVEATTTDIFSQLAALNRGRSMGVYKSNDTHYAAEAIVGKTAPKTAGTYNPAWQDLAGFEADVLTSTQVTGIKSKSGNYVEEIAGDPVFFEGRTFSGTFIDLVRSRDDLEISIKADLADLLKSEDIVPMDEPERIGACIEATIRSKAYVIPSTVVVSVPSYAEIPVEDRSNRNVPNITFSAGVRQGANTAEIDGALTLAA